MPWHGTGLSAAAFGPGFSVRCSGQLSQERCWCLSGRLPLSHTCSHPQPLDFRASPTRGARGLTTRCAPRALGAATPDRLSQAELFQGTCLNPPGMCSGANSVKVHSSPPWLAPTSRAHIATQASSGLPGWGSVSPVAISHQRGLPGSFQSRGSRIPGHHYRYRLLVCRVRKCPGQPFASPRAKGSSDVS